MITKISSVQVRANKGQIPQQKQNKPAFGNFVASSKLDNLYGSKILLENPTQQKNILIGLISDLTQNKFKLIPDLKKNGNKLLVLNKDGVPSNRSLVLELNKKQSNTGFTSPEIQLVGETGELKIDENNLNKNVKKTFKNLIAVIDKKCKD